MTPQSKDQWNPTQYEKFKAERSKPFFDLMALAKPIEGGRVVDLGCGTGEWTAQLHRAMKAQTTLGIDSSEGMLQKAEAFLETGLSFEKKKIEGFLVEHSRDDHGKFDLLFSNAALQWCDHHDRLLKEVSKCLAPGGQLAIQIPMNHDFPSHTIAHDMSREEPWSSLMNSPEEDSPSSVLRAEDYASLLFRFGFRELDVVTRVYGHVLDSREGVVEWVKGTLLTSFEAKLSADEFRNFIDEYRTRLFRVLPDDQPFFYPFKRMLIWGRLPK